MYINDKLLWKTDLHFNSDLCLALERQQLDKKTAPTSRESNSQSLPITQLPISPPQFYKTDNSHWAADQGFCNQFSPSA